MAVGDCSSLVPSLSPAGTALLLPLLVLFARAPLAESPWPVIRGLTLCRSAGRQLVIDKQQSTKVKVKPMPPLVKGVQSKQR